MPCCCVQVLHQYLTGVPISPSISLFPSQQEGQIPQSIRNCIAWQPGGLETNSSRRPKILGRQNKSLQYEVYFEKLLVPCFLYAYWWTLISWVDKSCRNQRVCTRLRAKGWFKKSIQLQKKKKSVLERLRASNQNTANYILGVPQCKSCSLTLSSLFLNTKMILKVRPIFKTR